jgi:multicomponent Na+:H+ antiporter subunit A
MMMAVLSGFLLSLAAPWLQRTARGSTGWILALLPLSLFIYFAGFISAIAAGQVFAVSRPWVPSLGVNLSFYLDGLSLIFALLVSGVGALVMIYAGGYLAGDEQLGRLYLFLLIFMAAMLGLALAGNLITLFIFWELTSVSSYLLIGFDHERDEARAAALQALLVTSLGGLALLAGLVLLGLAGESFELSALLGRGDLIRSHPHYLPILLLILLGAFTKSAQFPFHFWLPGAMEAPAPVSAYLHSATMVKAGVYLLARLTPALGGRDEWHYIVMITGAVTMLVGAVMAMAQTDLKRLLAYSTVSALGALTLLIGLGTTPAIKAAIVFLIVHSLYKGALFMAAGSIDHETGTRDVERLGGLRRRMPITAASTILAALSMAGLPPLFGFISKELLYEAKLQAPQAGWPITGAGLLSNVIMVSLAAVIALQPFFGRQRETPKEAHEAPLSMLLGPALLALMGLVIGLAPDRLATPLVAAAVSGTRAEPTEIELALWHGFNPILMLSMATISGGVCLYLLRRKLYWLNRRLHAAAEYGPARWYNFALDGLMALAKAQTRILQNGYLRIYLLVVMAATLGVVGYAFFSRVGLSRPATPLDARSYEWIVAAVIFGAVIGAVLFSSRLAAVAALGVVGFCVALIYILYGAPDLAKTQFAIETLTVILFVLVLYRLPRFADYSGGLTRLRDLIVGLSVGGLMTALLLAVVAVPLSSRMAGYFAENSATLAKGRNIVNVILVDFRALDTLGEIAVLSVAAIGVFALLRLRIGRGKNRSREENE